MPRNNPVLGHKFGTGEPWFRYSATIRQFTGGYTIRGYVFDRAIGRPVKSCPHNHRRTARAKACAEKMLRAFLRETESSTRKGVSI